MTCSTRGICARQIVEFASKNTREDSTGQEHHALWSTKIWPPTRPPSSSRSRATTGAIRSTSAAPDPGSGVLAAPENPGGLRAGKNGPQFGRLYTHGLEAPSSPSLIGTLTTGIQDSWTSPWIGCFRKVYAAQRRKLIDPRRASMEIRPGPGAHSIFKIRKGLPAAPDDTTHLDAIDSGRPTWWQPPPAEGGSICLPSSRAWGFALGVRGQMFLARPGAPRLPAAGKRPRTTLTPTLVLKDGKPLLAFGTLGGDNQDQWTLPVLPQLCPVRHESTGSDRCCRLCHRPFLQLLSGHKASLGVMNAKVESVQGSSRS